MVRQIFVQDDVPSRKRYLISGSLGNDK